MPGFRCYYKAPQSPPNDTICLDAAESHHLVNVRRARPGDAVCVFDGQGNTWDCVLEEPLAKEVRLRLLAHRRASPPACRITLAQALPKGKTMDQIVQKATELGASQIIPLHTRNSEVRLSAKRAELKADKWKVVAIEACKQSGNPYLPEITPAQNLESFCKDEHEDTLKLAAGLVTRTESLRRVLEDYRDLNGKPPERVIWLIGPEGDFTGEEYALIDRCGFHVMGLGPHVLKVETAATVALSILLHELRESS